MARVAEVAPAAAVEAPILAMTVETETSTRIPNGGSIADGPVCLV